MILAGVALIRCRVMLTMLKRRMVLFGSLRINKATNRLDCQLEINTG
jgi:hypothetical protein